MIEVLVMKTANKLTISVFLLLFSLLPWGEKQKILGKVFSFPISISISLARPAHCPLSQWVFARYLCKELMVFLIPVISLFLTSGPFATYVTNYFPGLHGVTNSLSKGEERESGQSGINCWDLRLESDSSQLFSIHQNYSWLDTLLLGLNFID